MSDRMNDPTKNPSSGAFNPGSRDEAASIGQEAKWRYPALSVEKPTHTPIDIWDAFKSGQNS